MYHVLYLEHNTLVCSDLLRILHWRHQNALSCKINTFWTTVTMWLCDVTSAPPSETDSSLCTSWFPHWEGGSSVLIGHLLQSETGSAHAQIRLRGKQQLHSRTLWCVNCHHVTCECDCRAVELAESTASTCFCIMLNIIYISQVTVRSTHRLPAKQYWLNHRHLSPSTTTTWRLTYQTTVTNFNELTSFTDCIMHAGKVSVRLTLTS